MDKRDTLLIVDDMEVNRAILRSLFEKEYNVLEAENGEQALVLLNQYQNTIEAMLLDLVMPVKNGYQVMEEMGRDNLLSKVSVIVITSDDTAENEVKAFDLGAADIIMKPFEPHVVKRRIQNIVELNRHRRHLEDLVEEQSASLKESNAFMIDTLSSVIEYRNLESGQHIKRIRMFTKILLEDVAATYSEYDLDSRKIEIITSASSMHDIGKIAIPDSILNKPGRLTKEEFDIMKTHTVKGCEILAGLDRMNDKEYLNYAYNICRYHHERWDGSGYPDGLKGDNIPICAQVVAIADCYDALTTDRVYKKALPQDQAFHMILNGECGVFSPRLLECFKNVREPFAELSRAYADGRPPEADAVALSESAPKVKEIGVSTQEVGQMKYLALLRYTNATVVEADLLTGMYHMVYAPDDSFGLLRSGADFESTVQTFIEQAVYPDDRNGILELLAGNMEKFFKDGLMRTTKSCRVYSQGIDDYCWYQATVLRVDLDNHRQRKVLLIWQKSEEVTQRVQAAENHTAQDIAVEQLIGGVHKCANDRNITLVQVDSGFLELTGYSRQELEDRFQNHFIELVYPADREELLYQMHRQLESGSSLELEYRIATKDGRTLWILDKGRMAVEEDGEEYVYCVLMDVTQSRQAQEELRLSLERHRIILEQTNDIIFEWDLNRDELEISGSWEKRYGYHPVTSHLLEQIPKFSHVNPDDLPAVSKCMKAVASGLPYTEVEFRMTDAEGTYRWYRARSTALFDQTGKAYKAVGVISDIEEEKKTARELQDKIERDVLTKLYNRTAARKKIIRALDRQRKGTLSAMLIIDIDDFKQVNDSFGHMYGDAVLTELAAEISKSFREKDVISRIGGDEFLVFMPDIPDKDVAAGRARRMIEGFHGKMEENLDQTAFSCSVGIAFAPADGTDFSALFQHSDAALYQAKAEGKNRLKVYDQDTMENTFGGTREQRAAARLQTAIDSMEEDALERITARVFDVLYEKGGRDDSVEEVLAMIGEHFTVSRAYIYEKDDDSGMLKNTFLWRKEGIGPLGIQSLPILPDNSEEQYCFHEDGIFYCQDVTKLPDPYRELYHNGDVASVLQCAICDGGDFKGIVGFDDCKAKRMWTQDQIDTLSSISKLLSVFLMKRRAEEATLEL